jgi:hypothetical protein
VRSGALTGSMGQRLTRAADMVRAALVCAGALFLIAGDGAAALKALLVLPPAFVGRFVRVPPAFDFVFAFALLAEIVKTSIGAYDSISWGDGLSHLVLPLLSGPRHELAVAQNLVASEGPLRARPAQGNCSLPTDAQTPTGVPEAQRPPPGAGSSPVRSSAASFGVNASPPHRSVNCVRVA